MCVTPDGSALVGPPPPPPGEALFSKHSAKHLCNVWLPLYPGKKREEKKAKGGLAGSF